jgi:hypothetical protein
MDGLSMLILTSLFAAGAEPVAIIEQPLPESCGQAVASSILTLYCGRETLIEDLFVKHPGELGLGEIHSIFAAEGLASRALHLEPADLAVTADRGFLPLVLHYEEPSRHFAILIAKSDSTWIVADPARGVEFLDERDFLGRWKGNALLVDPASITPEGRERIVSAAGMALGRRRLLLAFGEAAPAKMAPSLGTGLALGIEAGDPDSIIEPSLSLDFEFPGGAALRIDLPLAFHSGGTEKSRFIATPRLGFSLTRQSGPWAWSGWIEAALPLPSVAGEMWNSSIGPPLLWAGAGAFRIFDPVALGGRMEVGNSKAASSEAIEARLTAELVDALNELCALRLEAGLSALESRAGGPPHLGIHLGMSVDLSLGDLSIGLSTQAAATRRLELSFTCKRPGLNPHVSLP